MDFTHQVSDGYFKAVIPLKQDNKMWFFIDPFSYSVWLGFILCVPIYILAMILADFLFLKDVDIGVLCGFVIRNALSEQNSIPNHSQLYKRLLITVWIFCMMVLVLSYAGTLTAMLARSKLQEPITTFEELLDQNEVSWIIAGDFTAHYLRSSEDGSVLRKLYERGTVMNDKQLGGYGKCFPKEFIDGGMFGSLCSIGSILVLMKNDYSKTGKCNYYTTEDKWSTGPGASLAFQV